MRGLMLREHNPKSCWDIKRARGGLVETEFIAQYLQLVHAPEDAGILHTNTTQALIALRDSHRLAAGDATQLLSACQLYHRLTQVIRLCLATDYDPAQALPGLNQAVSLAAGTADTRSAEAFLRESQAQIAAIFDRIIGNPEKISSAATDLEG